MKKKLRGAGWLFLISLCLTPWFVFLLSLAAPAWTAPLIDLATQVKNVLGTTNGGTGGAITPPTSNGFYPCGFSVTASAAVPMSCTLSGLVGRNETLSTDTVLYSDNNQPVDFQGSVAVAVSLPTPTTLGNPYFWTILNNLTTGSSTALTVTPAGSWTINGSATLSIVQNQECSIQVDPGASTDWLAFCPQTGSSSVIASGTASLGTSSISSGACSSAVTVSASGATTSDVVTFMPSGDPTSTTGYAPSSTGSLYIWGYPTSGDVNFKVCNNTTASITPSALTLNWAVLP